MTPFTIVARKTYLCLKEKISFSHSKQENFLVLAQHEYNIVYNSSDLK